MTTGSAAVPPPRRSGSGQPEGQRSTPSEVKAQSPARHGRGQGPSAAVRVRAPHGGCGVGDRSRTDGREGGDVGVHGGRREEGGECDEGDCPADGVVVVLIEEIAASRGLVRFKYGSCRSRTEDERGEQFRRVVECECPRNRASR